MNVGRDSIKMKTNKKCAKRRNNDIENEILTRLVVKKNAVSPCSYNFL